MDYIDEEKAMEIIQKLADEGEVGRKIRAVVYREDYQDYLAVIGVFHYTDIRKKLLDDFVAFGHADVKNEIIFKLKHPLELDEFQREEFGITQEEIDEEMMTQRAKKDGKGSADSREDADDFKKKSVVDDSDKYDWLK